MHLTLALGSLVVSVVPLAPPYPAFRKWKRVCTSLIRKPDMYGSHLWLYSQIKFNPL